MMFIWDFQLLREDGSEVYLHPNYSDPKVDSYEGAPSADTSVPRSGLGGTSGPGTFKHFKNKHVQKVLKFRMSGTFRRC